MSDVVQNAARYRNRLRAELAKVEEFLRMAEEFSREGSSEARLDSARGNGASAPAGTPDPAAADRFRPTAKSA